MERNHRRVFSHWLFRLPGFRQYDAICIGRTILFRQAWCDVSQRLIEHEMVHQRQMDRFGVPGFYARYFAFYLRGLVRYGSHHAAYRNNPLEAEAYAATETPAAPGGLGGAETSLKERGDA